MAVNTIFDKFQSMSNLEYHAKYYADKLGMAVYTYYWDNINHVQIPSSKPIREWKEFCIYPDWRLTFNLTGVNSIKKYDSVEDYIKAHKRLCFNLTIKGHSIIYAMEFYDKAKQTQQTPYVQGTDDQLRFVV